MTDLRSLAVVGVFKETLVHQDSNYSNQVELVCDITVINCDKLV